MRVRRGGLRCTVTCVRIGRNWWPAAGQRASVGSGFMYVTFPVAHVSQRPHGWRESGTGCRPSPRPVPAAKPFDPWTARRCELRLPGRSTMTVVYAVAIDSSR